MAAVRVARVLRVVRPLGARVDLVEVPADPFIGLSAGLAVRRRSAVAGPRVHSWRFRTLLAETFARKHAELVDVFCLERDPENGDAIIMEAVFGASLGAIVAALAARRASMPGAHMRAVGAAIARSMAATHAFKGGGFRNDDAFVYGDLSPDDVLIDFDGRVRVARVDALWVRNGKPIGFGDARTDPQRAAFVAPDGMSRRGDLFSLGMILARLAGDASIGRDALVDDVAAALRDVAQPMTATAAATTLGAGASDARALSSWLCALFPEQAPAAAQEAKQAARQVLPDGGIALVDGSFSDELVRAVVARWGPKAPASAIAVAGGAESFTLQTAGPLTWLKAHYSRTGVNWANVVPVAGGFQRLEPAAAIGALLADAMPDLTTCVEDVLSVFETFGPAKVFRTRDDVAELAKNRYGGGKDEGADPKALAACEPPHFEGRALVFCANLGWSAELVRVRIDGETYAVQREPLGRGQAWMVPMGRAYVDDAGAAVLPAPAELAAAASHDRRPPTARHDVDHDELARLWRDNAALELVSVASFARASMELMAVGAPLALVERTHRAALDELEHARASYDVASRLDGRVVDGALTVPALAPRPSSILRVAVDALVEAAIPETIAAALAAHAAARCTNDAIRDVVARIAADEARHAQLAWDVVAWACHDDEARRACEREGANAFARAIDAVRASEAAPSSGFGLLTTQERDEVLQRLPAPDGCGTA